MMWNLPPIDSTLTTELPKVPGTIPQPIVTDEVLAGRPTRTLALAEEYDALVQPARHIAAHRKPRRLPLAVPIGATAVAFVLVAWLATDDPDPAVVPHVGPAATATSRLTEAKPKVKRPPVRRAEPVVLRSARPTRMAAPVRVVTVTPTPSKPPTPKPTTPRPAPSVTRSPTPSATPVITVTTDPETTTPSPDEAETTDTENFDGDA